MKKNSLSIFTNIVRLTSVAIVVFSAFLMVVYFLIATNRIQIHLHNTLSERLRVIPRTIANSVVIGDWATAEEMLKGFVGERDITLVRFKSTTGAKIEVNINEYSHSYTIPEWFNTLTGISTLEGSTPIRVGGVTYGYVEIVLTPMGHLHELWYSLLVMVTFMVTFMTINIFFVWYALRKNLSPALHALEKGSYALSKGHFNPIQKNYPKELQITVSAFNTMVFAIKKDREVLLSLLEFSPIAVRIAQEEGKKVVFANAAYASLIQLDRQAVLGQNPQNYYVHHEDYDVVVHAIQHETSIHNKLIELSIEGKIKWVLASYMPMEFEGEKSVLGWFYDITDKEFHKQELQRQKEEFETIFNISKDGIAILDEVSHFLDFNNAYLEMTGFTREELLTKSCVELSILEDQERARNVMKEVSEHGFVKGFEKTCVVKEGKRVVINMTLTQMPDKQRILVSAKDITQSKAYEQQLEHVAHYDPLTGLPNRLLNSDRLRQAMVHAQRQGEYIAILYLDLDGFKEVNDRYGHSMGDKLLATLSRMMQETLTQEDTLARLGGDEFVVILVGLDNHAIAFPLIQTLLDTASHPIPLDECVVQVSASVGVTFYPQYENVDADQLIRQADQAMYSAKQSGKNRYHVFDPDYDRTVRTKHENVERIQQALNNHEFVLHYQPKINMRTHAIIGAEALIRWQHPQRGLVPPADFLPIIEIHPLAIDVGEWVIQEAIAQIQRWKALGLRIPVSVNVGAKQLLQGNFVDTIRSILAQNPDFDPTLLEIEILETSALEDMLLASHIIQSCKTLGIHFALDDFGTGYSSLTYLKRLPIATLKIDQSFVRDMLDNRDDLAILEGIISLAKAFNRRVIAEGVETHAHGKKLLELGCELAQGYGIARPMNGETLVEWYAQWEKEAMWRG